MKYLIEYPLERGGAAVMEVEEAESTQGLERAARPGEIAAKAAQTLEAALEHIKPAAEAILSKLTTLSNKPDEVEVTFGLKASAGAGMIIASGTIEANYTVKLKWSAQTKKDVKTT